MRILNTLCSVILAAAMLTGCGQNDKNNQENKNTNEEQRGPNGEQPPPHTRGQGGQETGQAPLSLLGGSYQSPCSEQVMQGGSIKSSRTKISIEQEQVYLIESFYSDASCDNLLSADDIKADIAKLEKEIEQSSKDEQGDPVVPDLLDSLMAYQAALKFSTSLGESSIKLGEVLNDTDIEAELTTDYTYYTVIRVDERSLAIASSECVKEDDQGECTEWSGSSKENRATKFGDSSTDNFERIL